MTAKWLPIKGFEGLYAVSSEGDVLSERSGKNLTPMWTGIKNKKQYATVALCKNGEMKVHKVHRLVLLTFVGEPPEGCVACHRNDNTKDNRLANLYWGSMADNARDRVRLRNHHGQLLTTDQVVDIRRRRLAGERGVDLAKEFGVSQQVIWNVYSKRTGGYLHDD